MSEKFCSFIGLPFTLFSTTRLSTSRKLFEIDDDVRNFIGIDNLKEIPFQLKEKIYDNVIVGDEVKAMYQSFESDPEKEFSNKCFPKINSGEKVIIDCENDFNTWRDEHSGPFSWRSMSQEDVSLFDASEYIEDSPCSDYNLYTSAIVVAFKEQDRKQMFSLHKELAHKLKEDGIKRNDQEVDIDVQANANLKQSVDTLSNTLQDNSEIEVEGEKDIFSNHFDFLKDW